MDSHNRNDDHQPVPAKQDPVNDSSKPRGPAGTGSRPSGDGSLLMEPDHRNDTEPADHQSTGDERPTAVASWPHDWPNPERVHKGYGHSYRKPVNDRHDGPKGAVPRKEG